MSQKVKVGVAAISMEPVTVEQRRRDVVEMIARAGAAGCQLVCFPEYVQMQRTTEAMADVETACDDVYARYAEAVPTGPISEQIVSACRKHGLWAVYGVTERWPDGHATNSMVWIDDRGRVAGRHAKTHLAPGEDGEGGISAGGDLQPLSTPFGRVGVMTCYEIYFPEVARVHQAKGADWFFYPHADNQPKCLDVARVRAFDSRMPSAARVPSAKIAVARTLPRPSSVVASRRRFATSQKDASQLSSPARSVEPSRLPTADRSGRGKENDAAIGEDVAEPRRGCLCSS